MNVIFIDPPSLIGTCRENEFLKVPGPHMGILYIADHLKRKTDAHVLVLDMGGNSARCTDMVWSIKRNKPSFIVISSKTSSILSTYGISACIKKIDPNITVIVGGAHSDALPEYTLNECREIDAIVLLREAENTLIEVYERIKHLASSINDEIFLDLPGIVYRDSHDRIISNKIPSLLESITFPDLSLVGSMP